MWDALLDMLPYVSGLWVSPLPVAAVILLLVSANGLRKASVFEVAWVVVSFLLLLGLAALVGAAPPRTGGEPPTWEAVVLVLLGLILLALAAMAWRGRRRQQATGTVRPPAWMTALDVLAPAKVAGLAAVLIVANPVNASMLIAAAVELGHHRLPAAQNLLPAALFVLIGSLTVLLPYALTLVAGKNAGLLPAARRWLLRSNNLLTFWMTMIFGLIFLIKGLRAF